MLPSRKEIFSSLDQLFASEVYWRLHVTLQLPWTLPIAELFPALTSCSNGHEIKFKFLSESRAKGKRSTEDSQLLHISIGRVSALLCKKQSADLTKRQSVGWSEGEEKTFSSAPSTLPLPSLMNRYHFKLFSGWNFAVDAFFLVYSCLCLSLPLRPQSQNCKPHAVWSENLN